MRSEFFRFSSPLFFFCLALILGPQPMMEAKTTMVDVKGIPEFAEVRPGIFRGAQPTKEGYQHLKSIGIHTVVNFRHERDSIESGRAQVRELEMAYISLPWTIYGPLDRETVEHFFSLVTDPTKRPIFFHCKRGVERTGVLFALYLIRQGLTPKQAWGESFDGFPLKFIWKPFVKLKFRAYAKQMVSGEAAG
jgi:protein tyrosine phosphatase (PTP) superfamily phosphohydrolase (DUF442 family)